MEHLRIEATKYTPKVSLDPAGTFLIEGDSYPENAQHFYIPIEKWVKHYFENDPAANTVVHLEIHYINTSSTIQLFYLLDHFDQHKEDFPIKIHWVCDRENEIAHQLFEDIAEEYPDLPISLLEK